MKPSLILSLAFAAMSLASCGLRGDLERPDPLWGNPPAEEVEPAETTVSELRPRTTTQVSENSYRDPETGEVVWVENENGGDKPLASPVKPLEDIGALPPLSE